MNVRFWSTSVWRLTLRMGAKHFMRTAVVYFSFLTSRMVFPFCLFIFISILSLLSFFNNNRIFPTITTTEGNMKVGRDGVEHARRIVFDARVFHDIWERDVIFNRPAGRPASLERNPKYSLCCCHFLRFTGMMFQVKWSRLYSWNVS